jgi:hypothetical protein
VSQVERAIGSYTPLATDAGRPYPSAVLMPLLILLLNYLSVARAAPYVSALQEILERDPTLLHTIRQAVVAQLRAQPADSEAKGEASMNDVKRDASMDEMKQAASIGAQDALMEGWLILQRARATGYNVISKEDLAVMAADPATCLEPVMLFFTDSGLGRVKTSARDALDLLRWKVFRCEVLPDDDVPAGVPIEMRTSWREAERKRLQEEQEKSARDARAKAEAVRGRGLRLIRESIPRGCVLAQEDVKVIGADPETCMMELLITCGDMRVRTEARDCTRVMHLLEASGEAHVGSVTVNALAELPTPTGPDADDESAALGVRGNPEHAAELAEHISQFCGRLLQLMSVPR